MSHNLEPLWRQQLATLVDEAIDVAIGVRNSPDAGPDKVRLTHVLFVLAKLRDKNCKYHLPAPNGLTTLGIARGILDFIDDPKGLLVQAAGKLEKHYLTVPLVDPRFPDLPSLTPFDRFADGSTNPVVPDGQPVIAIQDRRVFAVGIWRRGPLGFDSHIDSPVNEAELMAQAATLIAATAPEHLKRLAALAVTCPPEIAEQMVWPEDQV